MRFRIEAKLEARVFSYEIAFDLPSRFREMRILAEHVSVDGEKIFSRDLAQVVLHRQGEGAREEARFMMDWHVSALPVIENPSAASLLGMLRDWLSSMVLLAPIPKLMGGEAGVGTLQPSEHAENWADWLSGLLDRYPAAYATVSSYLKNIMPDLADFRFERIGREVKSLLVRFKNDVGQLELPIERLSDGEKCFFLCALVLAANEVDGPLLTFWDEPDSHLALSEVSHFILALRRGVGDGGQIVMTSHSQEAIHRFSNENTWVMGRRSHLEPTIIRRLADMSSSASVIARVIEGDLDPWE